MAKSTAPRAWQRMLSGRRLDLLDPSPFDVEIDDIAHGLARVARWNGQTHGPHAFSVAQHALLVLAIGEQIAPDCAPQTRLVLLLHDAPEYVIGDMISPFKAIIGGDYKAVEARLMSAIHLRFGLPAEPTVEEVKLTKKADHRAAFLEATHLAGFSVDEALRLFGRPDEVLIEQVKSYLEPWPVELAQSRFLERFAQLDQMAQN